MPDHASCYPQLQRRINEHARQPEAATGASDHTLVEVARAQHLPAKALARAAHPHST